MKKLVKLMGLLVIAGALFFSCSSGNSDDNGGDSGNGGGNSGSGTSQTANSIQFSDGNWTVRMKANSAEIQDVDMYITLHATVRSNNYTFTSGTIDTAVGLASMGLPNNASDAEIEEMIETMNEMMAAYGQGQKTTYSYDKKTKTIYSCTEMTDAQLKTYSKTFDLTTLPDEATVTSNPAKTEYTITYEDEDGSMVITITKD